MVQYLYTWQYNKPLWATNKDEEYIKEAYNKIVWVYSCVAMISSCTSAIPWLLYRKQRNGKLKEIEQHPILDLLNKQINPHFSSKDFFDLWSTYLALQGKFYAEYNNSILPTQINTIYPHFMKPIPHRNNFVSGFEYKIGSDIKIYKADKILWSKFNDVSNLYEGLSPIKSLARTIDSENEAVDWNKNTLQNSAIPAGAISVMNPPPDIQSKIREDWVTRYGGKNNVRVPLVLNAEKATYVPFGLNPMDMDFLNQRKLNRIEICSAFGVPSQVVGDPEGQTYSNYEEAVKALWEGTVIPKYLDNMKHKLNSDLVARYSDDLILNYNLDDVQVLHESIDSIAERVRGLFKDNIITQNETRFALGYEEVKEGDIFNYEISSKVMENMQNNSNDEGEETEDNNEDEETEDNNEDEDKETEGKKKSIYGTDKRQVWKKFDDRRLKFEAYLKNKTKDLFKKELKKIKKISKDKQTYKSYYKEIETVINNNKKEWNNLLYSFHLVVFKDFGERTLQELQNRKQESKKTFDINNIKLQKKLKKVAEQKTKQITDTSKKRIKNIILRNRNKKARNDDELDFYIDGSDIIMEELLIEDLYEGPFMEIRAETISETETVYSSNGGSLEGAEQSEQNLLKEWVPVFDDRTRDTHAEAGFHVPIGLSDFFYIGSSWMLFPADPSGPPEETINCRCTLGYKEA